MKKLLTLDLSKRFLGLMAGLVLLSGLSSLMYFSRQEHNHFEMRLREKADFVHKFYAFWTADALMRKDDIALLQAVNRLEEDQEISAVNVVDEKGAIRYDINPQNVGLTLNDPMVKQALESGTGLMANLRNAGGKALVLVSPLNVPGHAKPIGALRVEFTFRRMNKQISDSFSSYAFVILGSVVSCSGIVIACLQWWMIGPLKKLRQSIAAMNPTQPEAPLPESSDSIGEINIALNELMSRFRSEWQRQHIENVNREDQEKNWVLQLARSFLPGARVLMADVDNHLLMDTGNGTDPGPAASRHLMDLIQDTNFATLLNTAFQQEGEVARGAVMFEDKSFQAAILSVPAHQSRVVKTLIALQPN